MKELISVIVPVYNVEMYIEECIQSIIDQTYQNWELILVDDGSPDNSGQICDKYAAQDSRIRVIQKKNGGLSDARNVALEIINGGYVTFVDSDDYLHRTCLEEMLASLRTYNADIVQCCYARDEASVGEKTTDELVVVLKNIDIMREYLRFGEPNVLACAKLYKTVLFNDIRFPKGRLDEDNFTTYKALYKSDVFVNINKRLYFYRENYESITHRAFKRDRFGILECIPEIRSYLKDSNYDYSEDIDYYELRELIQFYNDAVAAKADSQFANELSEIKNRIRELSKGIRHIESKYWLIIILLQHFEPLYKWIVLKKRH